MKKILLGLFFALSLVSLFSFSATASATGFDDVDWTVPMTSTAQAWLRIGVANFSKVWAYKATMTNGEVSALSLVCQYASSTTGVNPLVKECTTFINNDNTNLILVGFSNTPNAGMMADLLPGSGGAFALSDGVQYPRIVSASVLAPGASPTIAQLIPEVNYGFPSLPQDPIAQNGDTGWNYLPFSSESAWMGVGLPVPAEPGHYTITLIKNAGASQSSGPSLDFKANNSVGPVNLTALPSVANPVNLNWTASGVSSCTASTTSTPTAPAVWTGTKVASGTFAITSLAASATYQFKLDCSDAGGNHVIKSVTVKTPGATASVAFVPSTSPTVSVQVGQSATLNWISSNTASCTMSNGGTTPNNLVFPTSPAGTTNVTSGWATGIFSATGTYFYNISCNAVLGATPATVTSSAKVEVTAAPAATVTLTPAFISVQAGVGTVLLTWDSTNATSCNRTGGSTGWTATNVSADGDFPITSTTPVGTYTYSISCSNAAGVMSAPATAVVEVTAPPPPSVSVNFTPTPTPTIPVVAGNATTLSWTSSGVGICTKSYSVNGVSATPPANWTATGNTGTGWSTGNLAVGTYAYTITCPGAAPFSSTVVSDTATVVVTTGTPAPVATVTFTAPIPTSVQANGNMTLNWTSNNNVVANSCNRTGGFGTWVMTSGPANGSSGVLTAPVFSSTGNNSYTFTITCNSVAGATTPTATASVTVNVFAQLGPVTTVNITAIPNAVQVGQESTLKWNSSGIIGVCSKTTSSDPSGLVFPANWGNVSGNSGLAWPTGLLTTPGKYKYTITCTKPDGNTISAFAEVTVTTTPPVLIASITLNPATGITATVPSPGPAMLFWDSANVGTCSIVNGSTTPSGLAFPATPVGFNNATSGVLTGEFATEGVYTYIITCNSVSGATPQPTVSAIYTVKVNPPTSTPDAPTVTLTADPNPIKVNQTSTLKWSVTGDISGPGGGCTKTGPGTWNNTALPGTNGETSTGTLTTPGSATYKFKCKGPGGDSNEASVTVIWNPKTTLTVSVEPTNPLVGFTVGSTAKFIWSSMGFASCTKTYVPAGGIAQLPTSVTPNVSSMFTTGALSLGTYSLTISCKDIANAVTNASASFKVLTNGSTPAAPSVTLTANPNPIKVNQTSTLNWSVIGDISGQGGGCTKTGPSTWVSTAGDNGSTSTGTLLTPGSRTYTFSCTGPGGTDTESVTVTWNPKTTLTVSVEPTNPLVGFVVGSTAKFKWTSLGFTSCTKAYLPAGGIVQLPVPTTANVSSIFTTGTLSLGTYAMTISCKDSANVVTNASASFKVISAAPVAPKVIINATPNPVPYGNNTTVTWSSVGATYCTKTNGAGNWTTGTGTTGTFTTGAPNTFATKTYNISCTGAGGTTSKSVVVTVAAPVITTFSASPNPVTVSGGKTTVTWGSANANACTLKTGTGSVLATGLSGSWLSDGFYALYSPKTYVITCTGASGTTPATASVTVPLTQALLVNISASPNPINSGEKADITWSTTGASSCTRTGPFLGSTNNATQGSQSTTALYANKTYTITCNAAAGFAPATKSASVLVTVN